MMTLINAVQGREFVILAAIGIIYCFRDAGKSILNLDLFRRFEFCKSKKNRLIPYDGKWDPKTFFIDV